MDYRESLFNARSIDSTVEYNNSVSNIYQTRSTFQKGHLTGARVDRRKCSM